MLCMQDLYESPTSAHKSIGFFNEALCDHISLLVSLDALQYYKERRPWEFRKLPLKKLGGIDEVKMFFIFRAYAQCQATNEVDGWDNPTHPPHHHRVNRALANFEPFQKAYGCADDSWMVSDIRCPFLEVPKNDSSSA